jgi:hypothetical protein
MTLFLCPCSTQMSIVTDLNVVVLFQNILVLCLTYTLYKIPKIFSSQTYTGPTYQLIKPPSP